MILLPSLVVPAQAGNSSAGNVPAGTDTQSSAPTFDSLLASMLPATDGSPLRTEAHADLIEETVETFEAERAVPEESATENFAKENPVDENTGNGTFGEARVGAEFGMQFPAPQGHGLFTLPVQDLETGSGIGTPVVDGVDTPAGKPEAMSQVSVPDQPLGEEPAAFVIPQAEQPVAGGTNSVYAATGDPQMLVVRSPTRNASTIASQAPATDPAKTGGIDPVIELGPDVTPAPGIISTREATLTSDIRLESPRIGTDSTGTESTVTESAVTEANLVPASLIEGLKNPQTAASVATIVSAATAAPEAKMPTGDKIALLGALGTSSTAMPVVGELSVAPEALTTGSAETTPVDDTPATLQQQTAKLENALVVPALSTPVTPTGTATPEALPTNKLGIDALSGVRALAVESAVARGPQEVPLHRQLAGPIASLATGPHGDRTLSINIAPEALGPITVKAHLGPDGLRVELTAPTEAGRDALRTMLPELRRDLAATGTGSLSIGTATDHGSNPGGGNPNSAPDQRFGTQGHALHPRSNPHGEVLLETSAAGPLPTMQHSTHLDVMA